MKDFTQARGTWKGEGRGRGRGKEDEEVKGGKGKEEEWRGTSGGRTEEEAEERSRREKFFSEHLILYGKVVCYAFSCCVFCVPARSAFWSCAIK